MTEKKRPDEQSPDGAPTPRGDSAPATAPFIPLAVPTMPEAILGAEYAWDATDDVLVITPDDLDGAVTHDERRIVRRGNAKLPSAWVEGPGLVEILIEGIKLLQGASKAAGIPMKEIKAVIVQALPKVETVLIAPAKEGAPGAISTRRDGHGPLKITISDELRLADMEVVSGFKELFPVKKVPMSPIGPAIGIVLSKALVTRSTAPAKKKEQ
jgi:hypothetical protein